MVSRLQPQSRELQSWLAHFCRWMGSSRRRISSSDPAEDVAAIAGSSMGMSSSPSPVPDPAVGTGKDIIRYDTVRPDAAD